MNIPIQTKPALWGMLAGAIIVTVAGFNWFGWTTRSSSESMAQMQSRSAVVGALAPVCVERFQRARDASTTLDELKKIDSWSQGDFIEKGGWATVPGAPPTDQVTAVARACASLLVPV